MLASTRGRMQASAPTKPTRKLNLALDVKRTKAGVLGSTAEFFLDAE